jgi:hypothetical protein
VALTIGKSFRSRHLVDRRAGKIHPALGIRSMENAAQSARIEFPQEPWRHDDPSLTAIVTERLVVVEQ